MFESFFYALALRWAPAPGRYRQYSGGHERRVGVGEEVGRQQVQLRRGVVAARIASGLRRGAKGRRGNLTSLTPALALGGGGGGQADQASC